MEKPKRLTPKPDTVRELYLKSGNECAFPGCSHRIINRDGTFTGEVCHIEAALPGGARFDPAHTNENRRALANLMLMCHAHHKVTDDAQVYTVARMQEMKRDHEAKFTDVVGLIRSSIADATKLTPVLPATTLAKMNQVLDWNLDPNDAAATARDVTAFAETIRQLPISTREFVTVLVERGEPAGYLASDWRALFDDVAEATHLSNASVAKQVGILERYGLGYGEEDDRGYGIYLSRHSTGWNIWADVKKFCERTDTPVDAIFVHLKFNLFD